jgi:hypothetical protein
VVANDKSFKEEPSLICIKIEIFDWFKVMIFEQKYFHWFKRSKRNIFVGNNKSFMIIFSTSQDV